MSHKHGASMLPSPTMPSPYLPPPDFATALRGNDIRVAYFHEVFRSSRTLKHRTRNMEHGAQALVGDS